MAKAKVKESELNDDFELDAPDEQEQSSVTVISQSDLHDAFYKAASFNRRTQYYDLIDAGKAQEALELFDKYRGIAQGLKPGQQKMVDALKRLVKGK